MSGCWGYVGRWSSWLFVPSYEEEVEVGMMVGETDLVTGPVLATADDDDDDDDDDESVVDGDASEDGEPGVAASSHSHNHGQASSARCFILLIVVSLAHRHRFPRVRSVVSPIGRGNHRGYVASRPSRPSRPSGRTCNT